MMPSWFLIAGVLMAVAGLLLEGLGMLAVNSFPLRRKLPVRSPLSLVGSGGLLFVIGVVAILISRAWQ